MRVCSTPGCPALIKPHPSGKCPEHRREADKARGTRQQRGYDTDYDRERRRYERRMAAGETFTCWRCGRTVWPHEFSLGHCDDDRRVIHGPEHLRKCNLANTRGGCPHESHAGISPDA